MDCRFDESGEQVDAQARLEYSILQKNSKYSKNPHIELISPCPMLFITGDKVHSKEFSEDAYKSAAEPKELFYIKNAGHVDLYDKVDLIPFDKLDTFFKQHLK